MNHEPSDVDRKTSRGTAPEGDEADQPDQLTVDDWSDDEAGSRIDAGVLVAHSPGGDVEPLRSFAERMARDGVDELAAATDVAWRVHCAELDPLTDRAPRQPSEFLDEVALHMAKRPYDLVVIVTDVPLTTREERSVEETTASFLPSSLTANSTVAGDILRILFSGAANLSSVWFDSEQN